MLLDQFILFVDNQADPNRFLIGAIVFGVLAIACYLACYNLSTERIVIEDKDTQISLKRKKVEQ